MAATLLTAQASARGGTELTFTAPDAVDGIEFTNVSKKAILLVRNAGGSPVNATLQITRTVDGLAIPDRTVAIGAGDTVAIGPFNDIYNQSDNFVRVTFSSVTDITCALLTPGSLGV
jgi:hypothetical protein